MTTNLHDLRILRMTLANMKIGHWADPWEVVYLLEDIDSEIRRQENISRRMIQVKKLDHTQAFNEIWDF